MSTRILIVEDEKDFRETLVEILELKGYAVVAMQNIAEFNEARPSEKFDVAILDRTLPDGDGLDILKQIRQHSRVPVVLLTGVSQVEERVRGMQADADHYLIKPIDIRELLSIIERLLRNRYPLDSKTTNAWMLDVKSWRLLSPTGDQIDLTSREVTLLKCFAEKRGEVVHRDNVVTALGCDPKTFDFRRLDSLVFRFRKKLESYGVDGLDMQTVYGTGYAMQVALELLNDNA